MAARVDIARCDRNDADDDAEKRRGDEAAAVFQAFGIRCPSMTTTAQSSVDTSANGERNVRGGKAAFQELGELKVVGSNNCRLGRQIWAMEFPVNRENGHE
jgi:hypothetical protein